MRHVGHAPRQEARGQGSDRAPRHDALRRTSASVRVGRVAGWRAVVVLVGVTAALAGCAGSPGEDEASPRASGTESVIVSSQVRYANAPAGWVDATMDLYLPSDAGTPPLAVVVPDSEAGAEPAGGASAPTPSSGYAELARELAGRGVAVAVVRWGVESQQLRAVVGRSAGDVVAQMQHAATEVACAIAVAAQGLAVGSQTAGGTASRVVVVGHGDGANVAAMAALTAPPPLDACFTAQAVPHVSAALLWDGDWLGAVAEDWFGAEARDVLEVYSPWPQVDSLPTSTFVEVGVNANRLVGWSVETRATSSYLTTRDPGGDLTEDLSRVGAFDDDAVDPVDVARAFAVGLHDAGVLSREREVHGEGDPDVLGPRVRSMLVQEVVELTRP